VSEDSVGCNLLRAFFLLLVFLLVCLLESTGCIRYLHRGAAVGKLESYEVHVHNESRKLHG